MNASDLRKALEDLIVQAESRRTRTFIADSNIRKRVEFVCTCLSNRAGVRLLMACMLAKMDNPKLDPRKPYTEINTPDSFSGRTYDEQVLGDFIVKHNLPCNSTTAFLTPTLRNNDSPLTPGVALIGRPRELYDFTIEVLDAVARGKAEAVDVMAEALRLLLVMRDDNRARMKSLLGAVAKSKGALPLSSESIVTLLSQHLACKNSSRLPVLMVAAAYVATGKQVGEYSRDLLPHNAADKQTGALGDVEVCLVGENSVVTAYEMKKKRVTTYDIDQALPKIVEKKIHNYIFVTTDPIDDDVIEYAQSLYEKTGGTEIAVLDCIGFLRHFLHFFHRSRAQYLNAYQNLVLGEPDSAVSQSLKEVFLTLRKEAESDSN